MTENELELINMIREHNDSEQALLTAVNIIIEYLTRPESFESKLFVDSRELA